MFNNFWQVFNDGYETKIVLEFNSFCLFLFFITTAAYLKTYWKSNVYDRKVSAFKEKKKLFLFAAQPNF